MVLEDFFGNRINLKSLEYFGIGERVYAEGRQVMSRGCHDAYISYPNPLTGEKGIILVRRRSEPAKGYLWGLGGGIERGVPTLDSLKRKIKEESNLDISNPVLLGVDRYLWNETQSKVDFDKALPEGADDLTLIFYCEGIGELSLNDLHESSLIITRSMYTRSFRESLFPSVKKNMDLALSRI